MQRGTRIWGTFRWDRYSSGSNKLYYEAMKNLLLTPFALLLLALPAVAMTDEECSTMWKQADTNGDGTLNGAEADAVDAGAPLEGANSFTQAQAKDRIMAMGLSGASALTKDDKGIWRGTAQKDGKTVNVAVDFKGNVVTQ
jgi:putative membrane protein